MSEFQSFIVFLKDQEDAIKFDLSSEVSFFDVLEQVDELGWFISKNYAIPRDNISHIERIADIEEEEQGEGLSLDLHNYTILNDWEHTSPSVIQPMGDFQILDKPFGKWFENYLKDMDEKELEEILKDKTETPSNKDKVLDELNRRKKEGKTHE